MRKIYLVLSLIAASLLLINLLYPLSGYRNVKRLSSAYEWYRLGKAQTNKRDFVNAEKSLKKALQLDPAFYKALIQLGTVYSWQGEFIKAKPFFEKALLLIKGDKTNYEIAYYNLGKMYLFENDPENAWKYLEIASRTSKFLGPHFWPNDPADPVYYVTAGNKLKFYEQAKKYYSDYVRARISRIHRTAVLHPAAALKDCENYISDNPGSKYLADIIVNKAWLLNKLGEYDKSTEIINSLNNADLRDDLKEWCAYMLFKNYSSSGQYGAALKELDILHNKYPGLYSGLWFKYQKAQIYQEKGDYLAEKNALENILEEFQSPSGFERRPSEWGTIYAAQQRLFEVYAIQHDYLNGYITLISLYKSLNSLISLIVTVLLIGFGVLLFFIFSRIFFYKKTAEVIKSRFRLKYLWFFIVALALFTPICQLILFGFNYSTDNLLGRMKLDPYFLSIVLSQVIVAYLCVSTLTNKYQIDKETMGFVSRRARYNLGIPLLVLTAVYVFWAGYSYLLEKVLHIP